MKSCKDFLKYHRLRASDIDMDKLVEAFTSDMINGLAGKDGALMMIPTYIEADNDFLKEVPVLAIDAGGTNFRAALTIVNSKAKIETGDVVTYRMPGLEKEISAKEFFRTISAYIKPIADRSERIGFCFSYPTEILPDRDGRLIQFCKEVRAPEVVGQLIGKNLLETLGMPEKKIVLLNDTVATLLAGKSASFECEYDSYIGFILGTGTNTCYIESNKNILKKQGLDPDKSQIINIESGNFRKAPRTDLDLIFDKTTGFPGEYSFEKMFSGGYFGGLCLTVLKAAAKEGLFSPQAANNLNLITDLSSGDANSFAVNRNAPGDILSECFSGSGDSEKCYCIIDTLIDRASKLVAANLGAVLLKTGKGRSEERPVLITVEGTTFYKLHNLKMRIEEYFNDYLSGDRKRYAEFTEVAQSSLIGAAIAALTV